MQSIVFATFVVLATSCLASASYGIAPQYAPAPVQAYAPAPVQAYAPAPVQAYAPAPVQAYAPAPARIINQRVLSYGSPAPHVQCGSNVLVGCAPSVATVPCGSSPVSYGRPY